MKKRKKDVDRWFFETPKGWHWVAMGVSPWFGDLHETLNPEGVTFRFLVLRSGS